MPHVGTESSAMHIGAALQSSQQSWCQRIQINSLQHATHQSHTSHLWQIYTTQYTYNKFQWSTTQNLSWGKAPNIRFCHSRIVSHLMSVPAKLSQHSVDTWNLIFSIQRLWPPSDPSCDRLATPPSISDLFTTTVHYKSIYLLTYRY